MAVLAIAVSSQLILRPGHWTPVAGATPAGDAAARGATAGAASAPASTPNGEPSPSSPATSTSTPTGTAHVRSAPSTAATGHSSTGGSSGPSGRGHSSAGSSDGGSAATRVTVRQVKSPDFDGYCQATGQGTAHLVADNAYGWRRSQQTRTGDDVQAVCQWTNGTSHVTNRVADFDNPDSWQCWAVNGELRGIDWDAYCRVEGYTGAQDAGLKDAYTWFCKGSSVGQDSQQVCKVLYGSAPAVSRFQNFYDKNSWQCWR